jgi:hypothetical protein
VSRDLNNLAGLLYATNQLDEAEPLFRRALDICERTYGSDHPSVATRLNNLATLLCGTTRLEEGEPLYRRAVQILVQFQRKTGHVHPNFPADLGNYVGALEAMGQTSDQIDQRLDELLRPLRSEGS